MQGNIFSFQRSDMNIGGKRGHYSAYHRHYLFYKHVLGLSRRPKPRAAGTCEAIRAQKYAPVFMCRAGQGCTRQWQIISEGIQEEVGCRKSRTSCLKRTPTHRTLGRAPVSSGQAAAGTLQLHSGQLGPRHQDPKIMTNTPH